MATPHAAGAAVLYLQNNPTASPQAVRDQLVNSSTPGVVTTAGSGSPNRLLYTLGDILPPPPPPPPPTGCAAYPSVFTATLTGTGDSDIQPNGTYFYSAAGTHKGCLDGPNGVNFNLRLFRWSGSWVQVAAGTTASPDELVTYQGSAGYYYWKVVSQSGRGSYTFGMQRP